MILNVSNMIVAKIKVPQESDLIMKSVNVNTHISIIVCPNCVSLLAKVL